MMIAAYTSAFQVALATRQQPLGDKLDVTHVSLSAHACMKLLPDLSLARCKPLLNLFPIMHSYTIVKHIQELNQVPVQPPETQSSIQMNPLVSSFIKSSQCSINIFQPRPSRCQPSRLPH